MYYIFYHKIIPNTRNTGFTLAMYVPETYALETSM